MSVTTEKPRAGVDTPREDDIIVQCGGGCGRWLVKPHPRHVISGQAINPASGKIGEWKPTPEWVEAKAEREERRPGRCMSCGAPTPTEAERAQMRAEQADLAALLEWV